MMVAADLNVNPAQRYGRSMKGLSMKGLRTKKKPGPKEPGLRYWPREADTITFQEGLLNCRATGGGGHMRDATAQRLSTMILISAVRQPSEPHVSHAVSGPFIK
jgi:hypothetical protein